VQGVILFLFQVLSRAFRNRFIELHFEDIPAEELVEILHLRCHLPRSYSDKIVRVMKDLQVE
jgi:midasin